MDDENLNTPTIENKFISNRKQWTEFHLPNMQNAQK